MNVYILLDYNFKYPEDMTMSSVFNSPEAAIESALAMANQLSGEDICTHGIQVDGYQHKEFRISNHRGLGTDLGVTYKSAFTGLPMAIMVMERKLRSPLPELEPIEGDFSPDPQYLE